MKILHSYKYRNLLYLTTHQRKPFLIYSLCSSTKKNPVTFDTLGCTWGCGAARRLPVKPYEGENVNYFYNVVVRKVGKAFLSQT